MILDFLGTMKKGLQMRSPIKGMREGDRHQRKIRHLYLAEILMGEKNVEHRTRKSCEANTIPFCQGQRLGS